MDLSLLTFLAPVDATQSATGELLTWVVVVVVSGLSLSVKYMVKRYLEPKIGSAEASLLKDLADVAIAYAEEKSLSAIKERGEKLSSNEKLERAAHFLMTEALNADVRNLSEERVKRYIEGVLMKGRNGAGKAAAEGQN